MIIGGSQNTGLGNYTIVSPQVTQIDLTTGDKVSVDPGPLPGLWAPACTIDGEDIYVSGGGNDDFTNLLTKNVYKYNIKEGKFTLHGHLNTELWGHKMGVTAKGQLIVAGGYAGHNITTEIESSEDGGATWKTWTTGLSKKTQYAAIASGVPEDTFPCQ